MLLRKIQSKRASLIFFAVLGISFLGCKSSYERTEYYPTKAAALQAGAFERGWLPTWLPASSREIWEEYDQDNNALYIKFEYDECELAILLQESKAILIPFSDRPQLLIIREFWFPKNFFGNLYFYVKHEDETAILALDTERSIALLWSIN